MECTGTGRNQIKGSNTSPSGAPSCRAPFQPLLSPPTPAWRHPSVCLDLVQIKSHKMYSSFIHTYVREIRPYFCMHLRFLHFHGGLVFDSVKIHIYVDIPLLVDGKVVVCSLVTSMSIPVRAFGWACVHPGVKLQAIGFSFRRCLRFSQVGVPVYP